MTTFVPTVERMEWWEKIRTDGMFLRQSIVELMANRYWWAGATIYELASSLRLATRGPAYGVEQKTYARIMNALKTLERHYLVYNADRGEWKISPWVIGNKEHKVTPEESRQFYLASRLWGDGKVLRKIIPEMKLVGELEWPKRAICGYCHKHPEGSWRWVGHWLTADMKEHVIRCDDCSYPGTHPRDLDNRCQQREFDFMVA